MKKKKAPEPAQAKKSGLTQKRDTSKTGEKRKRADDGDADGHATRDGDAKTKDSEVAGHKRKRRRKVGATGNPGELDGSMGERGDP